jgi:D-alanine-D-alanine ligase
LKPNSLGVSVLCKACSGFDGNALREYLRTVEPFDDEILVQERVYGRELSCGTFQMGPSLVALPVMELHVPGFLLDHRAKFSPGGYTYSFLPRDDELARCISELSILLTRAVGFDTICRYDLMVSDAGAIHLLEANSKPGLTAESHYTLMLQKAGYSILDLVHWAAHNAASRSKLRPTWRYQVQQVFE